MTTLPHSPIAGVEGEYGKKAENERDEAAEAAQLPVAQAARRFEIEGHTLGYPTEFRDGQSFAGLFVVNARAANALIADSGFRVAEIAPNRAVLAFTCVHYTDTDCGSYNETAMAFFVEKAGPQSGLPYLRTWRDIVRGEMASFTWKLQVDTRASCDCGKLMWGFPKTIEDIDFEVRDGMARCTLRMDGREVFRFCVRAKGSQTPSSVASTVYSVYEGAHHVSTLTQAYRDTGYAVGGGDLQLGDHPLADELRSLGLPRKPLLSTWNGHLAFSMTAPERLRS